MGPILVPLENLIRFQEGALLKWMTKAEVRTFYILNIKSLPQQR